MRVYVKVPVDVRVQHPYTTHSKKNLDRILNYATNFVFYFCNVIENLVLVSTYFTQGFDSPWLLKII